MAGFVKASIMRVLMKASLVAAVAVIFLWGLRSLASLHQLTPQKVGRKLNHIDTRKAADRNASISIQVRQKEKQVHDKTDGENRGKVKQSNMERERRIDGRVTTSSDKVAGKKLNYNLLSSAHPPQHDQANTHQQKIQNVSSIVRVPVGPRKGDIHRPRNRKIHVAKKQAKTKLTRNNRRSVNVVVVEEHHEGN